MCFEGPHNVTTGPLNAADVVRVLGWSRQDHLDPGAGRWAARATHGHGASAHQDSSRGGSDDRDYHTGQGGGRQDPENGENCQRVSLDVSTQTA